MCFFQCNGVKKSFVPRPKFVSQGTGESASVDSLRNLIDDSVVEQSPATPIGIDLIDSSWGESAGNEVILEGCLRRKTLLKNGKKPPMASWQRFWGELTTILI
jgi:hypothetical protein